jgi:O-antigen/teichoic acid export membrane protein
MRIAGRLRSNIGGQAIALAATTGVAQLVTALLYVLTAKSAPPSEFGLTVSAIAVGTTAVGILDFGTNSYWVRELAARRMDATVLGRRLASKLFYSAAALLLWSVTTGLILPSASLWVAGPVAMATILSQSFQVPLRGLGRGDLVAGSVLVDKMTGGLAFFALLILGVPAVSALWLGVVVGGVASAAICWRLAPPAKRPMLRLRTRTNPWSESGHYGVANVALTAQSLDIPLLTMMAGAGAGGIYAAVSRWTQPMSLLASAFASASAPHIAGASTAAEAWRIARKSIWLLGLGVLCCLATAIFAPLLVEFLIGSRYAGSADVLRILAVAAVFSVINQPLFVFLQARGLDKPIAAITVGAILVQLTLIVLVSPILGATGAAISSAGTQLGLTLALTSLLIVKLNHLRTSVIAPTPERV